MDENLNLELDEIEQATEEKLKVKNRFEKLSEKVILTEKEKQELAEAKKALETQNAEIAKERDFFKDFSVHSTKYPDASQYQDKIWEKVRSGYSTEDAIVSTLNAEGKLVTHNQTNQVDIAGGSAPNQIVEPDKKDLDQMTVEEKLAALIEEEKKGNISI